MKIMAGENRNEKIHVAIDQELNEVFTRHLKTDVSYVQVKITNRKHEIIPDKAVKYLLNLELIIEYLSP